MISIALLLALSRAEGLALSRVEGLALSQDLAEIEVARGEKPKPGSPFKLDEDDGAYEWREGWGEGKTPVLPRPAKFFGAMSRAEARAWALDVVKASFEGDWADLSHPRGEPHGVDKGDGRPPVATGWDLDLLQLHKGLPFCDPDAFGDRAGVRAFLSDDLSGATEGPATASFRVRRWTVVKEHGPSKKVLPRADVEAAARKEFLRVHPAQKAKDLETEASLFWAVKPDAKDRCIPVWHVRVEAPGAFKPELHTVRLNAWTGALMASTPIAIPGAPSPR